MENQIDILDVLSICSEYMTDPEDEEVSKKFSEIKGKLVVRPYLYLRQKEEIIEKTLLNIKNRDESVCTYTSSVEISLTFDALLAYTNIDPDIISSIQDYDFYDILWGSGLCEYILQYCSEDYKRLTEMVYHMLSHENLFLLIDELKGFDSNSVSELTQEFKRFRLETKPESLVALGEIAASNDPLLYGIKHNIENNVINTIQNTGEEENAT